MRGLQSRLFGGYSVLILLIELFILVDLFFELGKGSLERGFLQSLGFLVVVDLAGGYKLVERLIRVLGNNRVNFLGSVLL